MRNKKTSLSQISANALLIIRMSWAASPATFVFKVALTVLNGLLPIANAYLLGRLINQIAAYLSGAEPNTAVMYYLIFAIAALQIGTRLISNLDRYLQSRFSHQLELKAETQLFAKVLSLDHSYYESPEFNNHLNKVMDNTYAINGFLGDLMNFASALIQVVGSAVALAVLNPWLVPILAVVMLPVLKTEMATNRELYHHWDKTAVEWRLMWYTRHQLLHVDRLKEIKLFGLQEHFLNLWSKYFKLAKGSRLELEKTAAKKRTLSSTVETLTEAGIQIWLLTKVLANRGFGIGDFQFYRQIIQGLSASNSLMVTSLQRLQDDSLYISDYIELMQYQPKINANTKAAAVAAARPPKIEFKNVSFSYPGSTQSVLKEVSFVINPGEDLAIVGANGAGKTTLIKLLLRLYDVTGGEILLGGRNIKEINLESWYNQVGVLFQDFNQYHSYDVKTNIGVGRIKQASDMAAIKKAATQADADGFIEQYDQKYDQVLDKGFEGGIAPSGGQWQRIALARAFFRDAGVLILDEPTSAVDAEGEYEIFKRIAATQANKTTIIVSHRFSTVRKAQKIIVLEAGRITESGSHKELMGIKNGQYKKLFELQAEGYK